MDNEIKHIPVFLAESVDYMLSGRKTGVYVDATLGGGATTQEVLNRLEPSARVISIDRDRSVVLTASLRFKSYANFTAVWENYRELDSILKNLNIPSIDGIVFDLGLSSIQLDDPQRGFSFRLDSQLDMRMDPDKTEISAYDLLNSLDELELRQLFRELGEERWAGRIASRIVETRRSEPIDTTAKLAQLVCRAIPGKFQHSRRIHPATRIFQALRIAVNDELSAVSEGIEKAINLLSPGGRIVVLSYHSGEDRIVKNLFKRFSIEKKFQILTRKPLVPQEEEIERNPRARSAKLRAGERL